MVAGSITDECAVAVPADRLWKVAFAKDKCVILPKACAGVIDAVEVDGDGGPGSVTTMRMNPAVPGGAPLLRTRVLTMDAAARVVRAEVLQGADAASAQLKKNETVVEVAPAGEAACVVKLTVEYECADGELLPPEEEAKMTQGYIGIVKMVEAYLVANPTELA